MIGVAVSKTKTVGVKRQRRPAVALGLGPAVYLIRHGKTALNKGEDSPDRIRGWKDIPLDATGKKEAVKIGKAAEKLHPSLLLSSDLSRAADVAKEIGKATGLKPVLNKSFRPWNLGHFQGKATKEVIPQLRPYIAEHPDKPVDGGESFNSFKNRFLAALKSALNWQRTHGKTVIIVTHFRGIKLAEAWIKGGEGKIDLPTFFKDDAPVGAVVRLSRKGGKLNFGYVHPGTER